MIYKSAYKPRFLFYRQILGVVTIIDGITTFIVGFFGYDSNILGRFSEWNIIKDIERTKKQFKKEKNL